LLGRDNVVDPAALSFKDLGIQPTGVEAVLPTYLSRFRPGNRPVKGAL
jgi:NADH dehydrogenase